MTDLQLGDLDGKTDHPELIFGTVAAVGTPWDEGFEQYLRVGLKSWGYETVDTIRVSRLLKDIPYLKNPYPEDQPERQRVTQLMNRGNELREKSGRGEALALLVAAEIKARRLAAGANGLSGQAFIVHQLKTPEEVSWLRRIYGDAFHLLGLYSSQGDRQRYLVKKWSMSDADAEAMMERDEAEANPFGQQVRKTFHRADAFIETVTGGSKRIDEQVNRFLSLLFGRAGREIVSPSRDEYGMYLAHAAGLRSTDLSRQVGAAILNDDGDVLGLGCNEVPAAGGGQYWEGASTDHRDFKDGYDYNERKRREIASEIIAKLSAGKKGARAEGDAAELANLLESTRLAHLIEFGRAVHAEMEALLSAARRGVAVRGAKLYTTVFPCHNCAKHIVGAGIDDVFYIEPYPKSLAGDMHDDSIWLTDYGKPDDTATRKGVRFTPFLGVAPRRYAALFQRDKMKVDGGDVRTTPLGLRVRGPLLSLSDREALAADAAEALKSRAS